VQLFSSWWKNAQRCQNICIFYLPVTYVVANSH
jgi:hypothetical protein